MNLRIYLTQAAGVFLLWTCLSAVPAAFSAEPTIATGELTEVRGGIEVRKRGGKEWIDAYEGMKIGPGDQISAGVDGHTVLAFKNSKTDIQPLTQFVVGRCVQSENESYTEMFLQIGKVSSKVDQNRQKTNKFNIVTPTSVAGVRGTIMEVSYFPNIGTEIKIIEGRGMASLISAQKLPKEVLPILGLYQPQLSGKAEKEATPEDALELFNSFLDDMEEKLEGMNDIESLKLVDDLKFEYVVLVSKSQRTVVNDEKDPASILLPGAAHENDAQIQITPEGISNNEAKTTRDSQEAGDRPESILSQIDQSTFKELIEIITEVSTNQGGIPPSTNLVPPALPDRTGKSNLSN